MIYFAKQLIKKLPTRLNFIKDNDPVRDVCFTIPMYYEVKRMTDGIPVILQIYGSVSTTIIPTRSVGPKTAAPLSLFTMKHAKMKKMQKQENYI